MIAQHGNPTDKERPLIGAFLNAWWTAVNISHNKEMEYMNNPTPEVVLAMAAWRNRVRRLHDWSAKRWGPDRVGKMIYEREHANDHEQQLR